MAWAEGGAAFVGRAWPVGPRNGGQWGGVERGSGVEYAAVARALTRFGRRMERTPELRRRIAAIQKQM